MCHSFAKYSFLVLSVFLYGCDFGGRDIESSFTNAPEVPRIAPVLTVSAPPLAASNELVTMFADAVAPDGVPAKVSWKQISGDPVTLSSTSNTWPSPSQHTAVTFIAPTLSMGSEVIEFEVTAAAFDNRGTPTKQTVAIDVFASPFAITAEDRNAISNATVSLHGSSNASATTPQTILWTQKSGTSITLMGETTFNPTFVAPAVLSKDTLIFNLKVTINGAERNATATVTVNPDPTATVKTVPAGNTIPPLVLKKFQATPGSTVQLNSLTSPEAGKTYQWNQLGGATVNISNPTTTSATFIMPQGLTKELTFQLVVTDTATGTTTMSNQVIHPGTPSIGVNTTSVLAGSPTVIHSTTITPAVGTDTHLWTKLSGPDVTLANAATSAVGFTAPANPDPNDRVITLQHSVTPSSTGVAIITTHIVNIVPKSAILHREINAYTGATVNLHADGVAATTYAWTRLSGPMVSLISNSAKNTVFIAPSSTSGGKTISLQSIATTPGSPPTTEVIVYTVHLAVPPPALSLTITTGTPSVFSGKQGVFHASVAGGTPPYSYVWTPKSGPAVTLDETVSEAPTFVAPTVASTMALEYSLTVTDSAMIDTSADVSINIESSVLLVHVSQNPDAFTGAPVGLHASASGNTGAVSYVWSQTGAGPVVTLDTSTDYAPSFVAPTVTAATLLTFDVTATDSIGVIGTGSTFVSVLPVPPSIVPALKLTPLPQLSVDEGSNSVVLGVNASGGDGVYTYSWVAKTAGITLSSTTANNPDFTAPVVTKDETLSFVVTVTDGGGQTASVPVTVLVRNKPLVVNAGNDIKLTGGTTTIHAHIVDATVAPYTYAWAQVSTGTAATISGATSDTVALTLPVNVSETYEFSLTVTDAKGEMSTDNVLVTATFDLGANAGKNKTVTEGASVSLHGLDVGGLGVTTVSWSQVGTPTVTLNNATTLNPDFTAPVTATNNAEELVFELTATDTDGRTASDTVSVFVEPRLPTVTVAGAGNVPEASASSLTATPAGGTPPYTYSWTQGGDFAVAVSSAVTDQTLAFTTPSFGSATDHIVLEVTVTDARGHTAVGSHSFLLDPAPVAPSLTLVESIVSTIVSGTSAPATVSVSGVTPPLTYAWTDTSTGSFAPSAAVQNPGYTAPVVGADTTVDVRVDVSDSVSASGTTSKTVLVTADPLVVNMNADTTVIRGQTINLHADVSGGIPPYILDGWVNASAANAPIGTGPSAALDTSTFAAGDYTITFTTRSSSPGVGVYTNSFILTVKNPTRTLTVPANANLKKDNDFTGTIKVTPTFPGESFAFVVAAEGSGPTLTLSSASGITTEVSVTGLAADVDETYNVTATQGSEILTNSFKIETEAAIDMLTKGLKIRACTGDLCGIIPDFDPMFTCPDATPYAMNIINNIADGNKVIEKKCATYDMCNAQWWQQSSDKAECQNFDATQTYNYQFSCTYCCKENDCNNVLFPKRSDLFIGTDIL